MYLQGFEYGGSFKFLIRSVRGHFPSVTVSCHGDSLEDKSRARDKLWVHIHTLNFTVRTDSNYNSSLVKCNFSSEAALKLSIKRKTCTLRFIDVLDGSGDLKPLLYEHCLMALRVPGVLDLYTPPRI